jgi:abequosyltransferase
MSTPLLTIIVPTYNRSTNLAILLKTLREETASVNNEIVVYVSDNCSTDDTQNVITQATEDWPCMSSYRHSTNIGAERNFCHAVDSVKTRWFWIIGDDDCPKRGVLAKVIQLLTDRKPALLYMQSDWVNAIVGPGEAIGELRVSDLKALPFAEALHVWVTFISGMVIDRERLLDVLGDQSIDRFETTSLVHLGWVLPMLTTSGPFIYIKTECIVATKGNSGGYNVLKVFGYNFQNIVKAFFGELSGLRQFADSMILRANVHYLPGLLRSYKKGKAGKFDRDLNIEDAFDSDLLKSYFYRFILRSIISNNKIQSLVAYSVARIISRILNYYDFFIIFNIPRILGGFRMSKK